MLVPEYLCQKIVESFCPGLKDHLFLLSSENNWPKMPFEKDQIVDATSLFVSKLEIKPEVVSKKLTPSDKFLTLINYYLGFHRLIRTICYIFRVVKACFIKN